jgi:hypothetical protein
MRGSDQESYVHHKERVAELERRRARIRQLNDGLRQSLRGGRILITPGVQELGPGAVQVILSAVRSFDAFTGDDDPHDEHDFGSVDIADQRVFWKIDYYDKRLEYGSPDPADPAVTARVITIMLASEY